MTIEASVLSDRDCAAQSFAAQQQQQEEIEGKEERGLGSSTETGTLAECGVVKPELR